jgi:phosphoribosyl-dephospho-CoA transferase
MPDLVRETVTPEDLALVEPTAGRDVPAMRTLAAARAILHERDARWGPTGSVGFELATGMPTATPDSDLDVVVRAPALTSTELRWLIVLHRHLVGLEARVDCQVDTRAGAIALAELVSDTDDVLVKTSAGPRLLERAVAVP